jgi:TFIIF-interacting CTD phosphatase-like protein
MQNYYELVIYTSTDKDYADEVLDFIETERQYFAHRLYNKGKSLRI